MKVIALLVISLFLIGFLVSGIVLLHEPKCTTASQAERLEMRCQKAINAYRG